VIERNSGANISIRIFPRVEQSGLKRYIEVHRLTLEEAARQLKGSIPATVTLRYALKEEELARIVEGSGLSIRRIHFKYLRGPDQLLIRYLSPKPSKR